MKADNHAKIRWCSRVPETSTKAKAALAEPKQWQEFSDQQGQCVGQGSLERGFRFLKDPMFLASSVLVKKPSCLIALSVSRVLCLLVNRLAE